MRANCEMFADNAGSPAAASAGLWRSMDCAMTISPTISIRWSSLLVSTLTEKESPLLAGSLVVRAGLALAFGFFGPSLGAHYYPHFFVSTFEHMGSAASKIGRLWHMLRN